MSTLPQQLDFHSVVPLEDSLAERLVGDGKQALNASSDKTSKFNLCRSFLGQVPVATGCCVLLARGLRTSLPVLKKQDERQHEESATDLQPDLLTFDYPGAITLAIWISSLLAVIDLQNQLSWGHPLVLSITIVGVLAILAFLALETYPGNRELLIPLRLLKTEVGAFCAGQVSRFLSSCNMFLESQLPRLLALTPGLFRSRYTNSEIRTSYL